MRKELLIRALGKEIVDFLSKHFDPYDDEKTSILMTSTQFNIDAIDNDKLENLVNLRRVNDFRFINKVFEAINKKLPIGGKFIGCVETRSLMRQRLIIKYPYGLGYVYHFFYYIFKRVFPKVPIFKKLYFFITAGRNRSISRAEALGRIYSCGFKITDQYYHQNLMYFTAEKLAEPDYNLSPSYGMIFKMRRKGQHGKTIYVYKFRTMHPYSEYLQDYIYENYSLKEGGKFNNDFRIHTLGKFMRKVWLDELPMLINLFQGDLKLVGVRPLSGQYLSLYTEEVREKRLQFKPGLLPPFYVDLPETLEEIMASEMRYLESYERNPITTDIRYFFAAIKNILIKKARSG